MSTIASIRKAFPTYKLCKDDGPEVGKVLRADPTHQDAQAEIHLLTISSACAVLR
jgi:hypothetical protein